jgi:hypothetical protein
MKSAKAGLHWPDSGRPCALSARRYRRSSRFRSLRAIGRLWRRIRRSALTSYEADDPGGRETDDITAVFLELQRDWARADTYDQTVTTSIAHSGAYGLGDLCKDDVRRERRALTVAPIAQISA